MNDSAHSQAGYPAVLRLKAGEDLFHEQRGLTMSAIDIKVSMQDGSLLILENTFQAKGGPSLALD